MLEILFQVIIEVLFYLTGHLVVTLGRWKIDNGRDDAALIVGILFWIGVGAGIWFAFFR